MNGIPKMVPQKLDFLLHDLIVRGNVCNLSCSYCTSTQAADDFDAKELKEPTKDRTSKSLIDCQKALGMVDAFLSRTTAPLLKVSGGELFLFRNSMELVEELSKRYAYVQVLTNGTKLSDPIVERIARLGNVGFNLSLDGHTLEMNSSRWRSDRVMSKVMSAFHSILKSLGEVELTNVITDVNVGGYEEFLNFLMHQPGNVISVPLPVRGVHASVLFQSGSRQDFATLLPELVKPYGRVLAPAPFCLSLARFLMVDRGVRERRCHVPNFSVQLFDSGEVTPCSVGWTVSIGNALETGVDAVVEQIGTHKIYEMLTRSRPRVPVCRSCYSLLDSVNLFLEGEMTLQEITRFPQYRAQPIQQRLLSLRERILKTNSSVA
jgi:MoaA/NifB/PqqE/SkfB family radical SAM enzyme